MLKKLFISKVRISILGVYLSDLDTSHHVRELVRILDEEINSVRRELMNLESAGLLKSKKEKYKTRLLFVIFKSHSNILDFIKGEAQTHNM